MTIAATRRETTTGGRDATTRHIPPKLALAVGMPSTPAPGGWRWSSLTKLARMESGHTPSRRHPEYWHGEIPWIGIRDAKVNHGQRIEETEQKTNELGINNSSARLLPENTVCLSRTASVGYVLVMGRPMATSQDFVNWVCNDDLEPDFLKYLLIAEGDDILRFASGSVHQTIYFPEAKAFHICHPEVPEQRRIVGILDEAFAGIATAKANAQKNLQNARAVFESHLNAVFTQRGDGWGEKKLSELYAFKNGINFDKTQKIDRGILTIDVLNMYGDDLHVNLDNLYRVNKEVSSEYILREGDLLVVRSSVKREGVAWATLFRRTDEPITFCGFIIRGRPIADILPEYAAYFMRCPRTRDELIRRANQSTITNINQSNLGELRVPIPDIAEQTRIVGDLGAIRAAMLDLESIYRRKLAALDELKKSLLHQAFSGQLWRRRVMHEPKDTIPQ